MRPPQPTPANVIAIDVRALGSPDERILDALVRLQLAAHRQLPCYGMRL